MTVKGDRLTLLSKLIVNRAIATHTFSVHRVEDSFAASQCPKRHLASIGP